MATQFEVEDRSVVEFQLGNKQLLLLFLGLLVICAIFFFIGLRVGEDTARSKMALVVSDESGKKAAQETQGSANTQSRGTSALAVDTKPQTQSSSPVRPASSPASTVKKSTPSEVTKTASIPPKTTQKTAAEVPAQSGPGYYVQVAAPTDESRAVDLKNQLLAKQPTVIQQAVVDGRLYYRVRVGPFPSKEQAEEARLSLLSSFPKAFLAKI